MAKIPFKRELGTSKREQGVPTPADPGKKIAKALKKQYPLKKPVKAPKLTKAEKKAARKPRPVNEMVQVMVPVERKSNKGVKYLSYVPTMIPRADHEQMLKNAKERALEPNKA